MIRAGLWQFALWGLFISCLAISWKLNAQYDYLYSFWYDFFSIESHIQEYAPQNYYKQGFAQLDKPQYVELFTHISQAVHHQGAGLEDLHYVVGQDAIRLLTNSEVVHLQDVANLIESLDQGVWLVMVFSLLLWAYLLSNKARPVWRTQLVIFSVLVGGAVFTTLGVGSERVFYWLHELIFPDNHQWFFYYQESLMSTLMKAPDLFAGIALAILGGAFILFLTSLMGLMKCLKVWRELKA